MALTPEERAIVEYGVKQGKSKEEILAALTAYRAKQIKREPGGVISRVIKDIPQDIVQTASEAKQAITEAGTGVVRELQSDRPLLDRLVGAGSEVFRGIGRTIGAFAGGALRLPFTQQFEDRAAQAFDEVVAKAVQTAPVQSVARWYASQPESVQHNIRSALGYAEGLAAIVGGGRAASIAERQLSSGLQKAQQAAQAVKTGAQRVSEAAKGAKNVVSNIARPAVERIRELAKSPTDDIAKLAESGDVEALKQAHLKAIDELADLLDQSAQRSVTSFRSLNTLARLQSTPETPVDRPTLLKALIAEGVVPELDGDRLSFSTALKRIAEERERVVQQQIEPVLKELTERGVRVPISQLEKQAKAIAKEAAVGAELPRIERQVSTILKGYAAKYGKRLTPEQLNRMRVELNRLTRAYRNNELYKADAADIVAKAVRNTLYPMDERIVPAVQQVERLQIAEKVAKRLEGVKVDPGIFAGALGRYLATVGAGAFGGAIVAGGPGSLVLAGLIATLGEKATVDLFLKKKLPKDIAEQISKALEANPQLREQLVKAGLPKTFRGTK